MHVSQLSRVIGRDSKVEGQKQPRTQGVSSCGEDPDRRWSRDLLKSSRADF
jgi:hypothetical protein